MTGKLKTRLEKLEARTAPKVDIKIIVLWQDEGKDPEPGSLVLRWPEFERGRKIITVEEVGREPNKP